MRRLVREESGFTLVELVVVGFVTVLVMAGLSNLFVSGLRTGSTTSAILASQTNVHTALDRLEFETRCAAQATLLSSGGGVALSIPTNCPHATGTVSWCVSGGALERYTTANCSGAGQIFARSVTSTAPFSCVATVGDYPQLKVALAVNSGTIAATAISATDTFALRNAPLVTTTSAACA